MKKKSWGLLEQGKTAFSKLSLLMAFTLAFSILPAGALAEEGTTEPVIMTLPPVVIPPSFNTPEPTVTPVVTPIKVSGENTDTVIVGTDLQMVQDSSEAVVWSVNDVNAGELQSTQEYATINPTTGLLRGLAPGIVRVTATGEGVVGSTDITVVEAVEPVDPVGEITGTPILQGGANVTLGKTKFTGFTGTNTFWATSGQELAEKNPGTSTTLSSLKSIYTINISDNPFVPAAVGQTISVIEVNGSGEIVGFDTFTVENDTEIGTNEPPIAKMSEISVSTGGQAWQFINNLFTDPEGTQMYFSKIVSSDTNILTANPYYDSLFLTGVSAGSTAVSFEVRDQTGDKIKHTLNVLVGKQAPSVFFNYDTPFTNLPASLTFTTNTEWTNAITSIEVNNLVLQMGNYTLTDEKEFSDEYGTWTKGEILIHADVLKEGENRIVIRAEGYTFVTNILYLHKSEESFYTSPLTINKVNGGITTSFKSLYNNDNESYWEQATAIFQLMNGNVPVSTVSFTIEDIDSYQSFQAQFSLVDATTNPNYSVRAFLITGDNADNSLLGHNLATEVSQDDFDALYQEWRDDY